MISTLLHWKTITRIVVYGGLLILLWVKGVEALRYQDQYNGFPIDNALIPITEIHRGGPPKDGIPAIDKPTFIRGDKASGISSSDPVLGLDYQGVQRAYPINIMNWHEIVNDQLNDQLLLITYCPLCGTGMAFLPSGSKGFGVSGLLYNSDMLLYDRSTESLWSQIKMQAISGPRAGEKLVPIPLELTTWQDWLNNHPRTQLLSQDTGANRDYTKDPYQGYSTNEQLYFPVANTDQRYHPKMRIIGLTINHQSRAWPIDELLNSNTPLSEQLGGQTLSIHVDKQSKRAWITNTTGNQLPATSAFWFAWHAFYPDSSIYTVAPNPMQ